MKKTSNKLFLHTFHTYIYITYPQHTIHIHIHILYTLRYTNQGIAIHGITYILHYFYMKQNKKIGEEKYSKKMQNKYA